MNVQAKKRTSLKRQPAIEEVESTPKVKPKKRISFSVKNNVKEFHDGECGTVWNESYELSANCQTASDQGGDTQATVTDMTSHATASHLTVQMTHIPAAILNGPDKENIGIVSPNETIPNSSDQMNSTLLQRVSNANETRLVFETNDSIAVTPTFVRPKCMPKESLVPMELSMNADEIEIELTQAEVEINSQERRRTIVLNEKIEIDQIVSATEANKVGDPATQLKSSESSDKQIKKRETVYEAPMNVVDATAGAKVRTKIIQSAKNHVNATIKSGTSVPKKSTKKRETVYEAPMTLDSTVCTKVRTSIYEAPSTLKVSSLKTTEVKVVRYNKRETVHEASMMLDNEQEPVHISEAKPRKTEFDVSMAIEETVDQSKAVQSNNQLGVNVPAEMELSLIEKEKHNPRQQQTKGKRKIDKRTTTYEAEMELQEPKVEVKKEALKPALKPKSSRTTIYDASMIFDDVDTQRRDAERVKGKPSTRKVLIEVPNPAKKRETVYEAGMTLERNESPKLLPSTVTPNRRGTVFEGEMNVEQVKTKPGPSKIPTPQKRKTALGGDMDVTLKPLTESKQALTPSKFQPKQALTPSKIPKLVQSPARKKRITSAEPLQMEMDEVTLQGPANPRQSLAAPADMELSMIECKSVSPSFNLGHRARSTMYDVPINLDNDDDDDGSNSPKSQPSEVSSLGLIRKSLAAVANKPTKTIFSFKRPFAMIESPKVSDKFQNIFYDTSSGKDSSVAETSMVASHQNNLSMEMALERLENQRKTIYGDEMNCEDDGNGSKFAEKIDSMRFSLEEKVVSDPDPPKISIVNVDNKMDLTSNSEHITEDVPMEVTLVNDQTVENSRDALISHRATLDPRLALLSRRSSLGFELTREAVKEQVSLNTETLPQLDDLSTSSGTSVYRVCSVGNLTMGTSPEPEQRLSFPGGSDNELDKVKDKLNVLSIIDSLNVTGSEVSRANSTCVCTPDISAMDTTLTPSRRSSLSNPLLERMRQQLLSKQPMILFCPNCQCSPSPAPLETDVDTKVEELLGLDKMVLVERTTVTLDALQKKYQEKVSALIEPSPLDAYEPKNPGLLFLLNNLHEQALAAIEEEIESDNEFARVLAPFPEIKDYAFLIENKLECENYQWDVRRSVFAPTGVMQFCHKRLKSVLLHVVVHESCLKADYSGPFRYKSLELVPNRLRPPLTPVGSVKLDEFQKLYPFGSTLTNLCDNSNQLFDLFQYLDEVIMGCSNRAQQLFSILLEHDVQTHLVRGKLFGEKKMIFDEHRVILTIHLALSNVQNFSPDCISTEPTTAIVEKLQTVNYTGVALLEFFLANIRSILFS